MVSKKIVLVNGKEMNTDSQEWCDYLTAEFIKRKEQAKKNKSSRKKTKSVMAQVSTKIEQGVEKAIKTGVSKQMPTIKKNPQVFIGKVQKLETATKNFLTQLKEVLGTEYDAKEVTDTTKAIHKLIEDLKKKYTKK
jgi:D-aminopeptidase